MHGGKRQGAGRKPGSRVEKTADAAFAAAAQGITPVEYLLSVMRDDGAEQSMRLDAAKAAAPYIHPRLNAITVAGDQDAPMRHVFTWER